MNFNHGLPYYKNMSYGPRSWQKIRLRHRLLSTSVSLVMFFSITWQAMLKTTEAYIRHWLMRYYLELVKIIARYEIIIA